MLKTYGKKVISVLLCAVMLVTLLSTALPFMAGAAITKSDPADSAVHFYVPETIYLTPSTNAEGTSTAMQYYMNSFSSHTSSSIGTYSANGAIYFYCANAVSGKLTYSSSTGASLTLSRTEVTGSTFSATFSGSAQNKNGLITWVYTYLDANGVSRTVTSGTYIYKPSNVPAGAAIFVKADNDFGLDSETGGLFCLWGAETALGGNYIALSNAYISNGGPLLTAGNTKANHSDLGLMTSGNGSYNYSDQGSSSSSGSSARSVTSPAPSLYVDSSRFSNLNEIPYLKYGYTVTNMKNGDRVEVSIYFDGVSLSNESSSSNKIFYNYSSNKTLNYALSNIANGSSKSLQLRSYIKTHAKSNYDDSHANLYVNLGVYNVNKSALRTAYLNELKVSLSMQQSKYTSATWAAYDAAVKNACVLLGNPRATSGDISIALTNIETAKLALVTADYSASLRHIALIPNGTAYTTAAINTTALTVNNLDFKSNQNIIFDANVYEGYTVCGYKANQNDALGAVITLASITAGNKASIYRASSNLSYTFYYIINTHAVKYFVDGALYAADSFNYMDSVNYRSDISKTGHTFSGWVFTDKPATMPNSDIIVNGSFTINQYELNYFVNGEKYDGTETYDYNAAVIMRPDIVRTGYVFSGWDKTVTKMPAENVNVNATLTPINYSIKYEANANTGIVSGSTDSVSCIFDKTYAVSECGFTRENYIFTGWNTKADGSGIPYNAGSTVGNLFSENNKEFILYAQWKPADGYQELIYYVDNNEYARSAVKSGSAVTPLTAPQKTGYTFSGWDSEPTVMPGSTKKVYGSFSINTYYVNYYVDNTLHLSVPFEYNAPLSVLDAPVREGYSFGGWSAIPASMPAGDIRVDGSFTINSYKLIYYIDGAVYLDCGEVEYNTALIPPEVTQRDGYIFSGWNAPATMPANELKLYATFDEITYAVVYYLDGAVYHTDRYPMGAAVSIQPDVVKTGYTFSGWTWSEQVSVMPERDITVNGTLTANPMKIIYNANGADGTMSEQAFVFDQEIAICKNQFSNPGNTFLAWNTKADGTGVSYYENDRVKNLLENAGEVLNLYAQWVASVEDLAVYTKVPAGYIGIHTADGLQAIIASDLGAKYILMADINLTGYNWKPLGTAATPFTGILLGNGHKISGLKVTADDAAGLFAYTDGALIKDIAFTGVNIKSNARGSAAGTVAGFAKNTVVKNCAVMSGSVESRGSFAGGIIGKLDAGALSVSFNSAEVLSVEYAGGIAGSISQASINNVYNKGAVTGFISAGSIAGYAEKSTINNVYNVGAMNGSGIGGIVGTAGDAAVIRCAYYLSLSAAAAVGSGNPSMVNVFTQTSPEMKTEACYRGFDFEKVWSMGTKDGYPLLRSLEKVFPTEKEDNNPINPDSDKWWQVFRTFFIRLFEKIRSFFDALASR